MAITYQHHADGARVFAFSREVVDALPPVGFVVVFRDDDGAAVWQARATHAELDHIIGCATAAGINVSGLDAP